MKHNATLLLLIAAIFLHTNVQAYSQGITLKVSDVSLDKVFNLLQKQTKFVFVYSAKQLAGTKRVSVDVTNEKFEKVMQMVMDGQPLRYEVDKEYVIIKVKMPALMENEGGRLGELTGRVMNEKGEPVAGATVTVKNSNINAATDPDGYFTLKGVDTKAELIVTSIGYEPKLVKLTGEGSITIKMIVSAQTIKEIVVRGNTGYQVIGKEHPGSFDVIDNRLISRKISSDVLSRIENLTAGISFNNSNDGILIRGRNSIFSNVSPLIILDNFPYDGDIKNINPNDVDNVTILKDAAAAAQWGARAGNGVIVITTKRGKTMKPNVSLTSNFTIQAKPDLYKLPIISSAEEIEVEKWLFEQGYYNGNISNTRTYPVLSPTQEILLKKRNGQINVDEANRLIDNLKHIDVRNDLLNFFYQPSFTQQYALNVSGIASRVNYYFSAGFDKLRPSVVGNLTNRISLKSLNTFRILDRLSIDAGLLYTQFNSENGKNDGININSGGATGLYPYANLVDDFGNALSIVKDYNNFYKDTAGQGKLLDWQYKPYDEMGATNRNTRLRDFLINIALQYNVSKDISAEIRYQFQNQISLSRNYQSQDAYYVRDLINRFYQPNSSRKYPVPLGGILDIGDQESISHQGRVQVRYTKSWNNNHNLNIIGGLEVKSLKANQFSSRIYGYQKEGSIVNTSMDFVTRFPQFVRPSTLSQIPNMQNVGESVDRFVSYFVNSLYSYKNKYIFSGSARVDEANLFGVETNRKRSPLWSVGLSWNISNESFYNVSWLSLVKARMSYGHTGNFSRSASGVTTMEKSSVSNFIGFPYATIVDYPNSNLRWEQNRILNIGVDFELMNKRVSGTFEFFKKHNKDLMAQSAIDPSTGLTPINGGRSFFFGNVASVKGEGYEFTLNTINLRNVIKWSSTFIFSYSMMKVSEYFIPASKNSLDYVNTEGAILPVVGKPIYTFYAYRWGGLDPSNGNPLGYLRKEKSNDYQSIFLNTSVDSLIYKGMAQPPITGSFFNSIGWKNFEFSANIIYRYKYFVRRPLLSYSGLYSSWTGHSDYSKRWQKSGDERFTNVPSEIYVTDPDFGNRQQYYLFSEVPIIKGDHIKLSDIAISYTFTGKSRPAFFDQIRIYGYLSNLNFFLWRANNEKIDPDFPGGRTSRSNISFGVNVIF